MFVGVSRFKKNCPFTYSSLALTRSSVGVATADATRDGATDVRLAVTVGGTDDRRDAVATITPRAAVPRRLAATAAMTREVRGRRRRAPISPARASPTAR